MDVIMISGVLYALLAGLMWGLIFVGPLLVPEYPAVLQSMGRYLALGLIALPLAWLGRARLRQLNGKDWWTALALTMMGNLIYYFCLASAIQRTGAPVSTMIIGTLPVVLPVCANLLYSQRDGKLPWRRLFPALICIALGLVCVNVAELQHGLPDFSPWRYGSGIVLALIAVVCWAWYALRNARWLRENPDKPPMMWATAQALVTLPLSLVGYIAACWWLQGQHLNF
ncbi:EamA family transporter, partial [Klebsiella aerogenes]